MNPSSRRRLAAFAVLIALLLLGTFTASVLREDDATECAPPPEETAATDDTEWRPERERVDPARERRHTGTADEAPTTDATDDGGAVALVVRVTDAATGEPVADAVVTPTSGERAATGAD